MALPSFLRRKDTPPAPMPVADGLGDDTGPVQVARTRARRRLIGAVLLLAVGVIVFPMLFETQPRPLPGDIPIEVPRREGVAARPSPLPRSTPAVTELPPVEPSAPASSAIEVPVPPPAPEPKTTVAKVEAPKPEPEPKAKVEPKPEPAKPEPAKPEPVKAAEPKKAESDRARAILEGRPDKPASAAAPAASDPKGGRFVVQVGAYTDANTLREVRAKVEKLGLRTYTQSVDTDAGKRTRVRVGPFPTKSEAERASDRLKGAGLPGNVLTL